MSRSAAMLILVLVFVCIGFAQANDSVLGQQLGDGVHAYFAGDYAQAHEHLTNATEAGSQDPRVFYFRGLSYLRLGRQQEAAADFQRGATLESNDVNKFYDVPKSLERVQGQGRIQLEAFRRQARMAVMQQNEKAQRARYEAIRREEDRVLRDQLVSPPEESKPDAQATEATADANADLFGDAEEAPAAKPSGVAAKKKPVAVKKDEVKSDSGENPFATPAPEKKPAAKTEKKASTEDSGKKADADDPFAE